MDPDVYTITIVSERSFTVESEHPLDSFSTVELQVHLDITDIDDEIATVTAYREGP